MTDPDRDPAVAEQHWCPFCHAEPGEPCADERGIDLPWPHYSRTPEPAP